MTKQIDVQDQFDISSDGRTVWVNALSGMCVGRFTARGVDIHVDADRQLAGEHCLDCFGYKPHEADTAWERFKQSIHHHYGLVVPDTAKPKQIMAKKSH